MPQPGSEDWQGEIRRLAERVERIERELGLAPPSLAAITPEPTAAVSMPMPQVFPVLGRALLGLAGAYLLRAITEASAIPPQLGVGLGLSYAMLWLVWAARVGATRRLDAALHSLTSALVLSPLLWEATFHFHAISTWGAGAILLAFTLFGLAVSWRNDLRMVAAIATITGLGTAAALLVATQDVLPFTVVFLGIAAAVEASACFNHWLGERWLAAATANLAILLATWLVTNERGLPPAYAPIPHGALLAAQAALLVIYLSSIMARTLFRGFAFTGFETTQCGLAFLIGIWGGMRLAGEDPHLGVAIAAVTLICAAACYCVSFTLLDRGSGHARNFYTYSTFALLLTITGTRILLAGNTADAAWVTAAVACLWAGARWGRLTLQVHGGLYLLLALWASGAFGQAAAFLLGEVTWPGTNGIALALGALAAGFGYAMALRVPLFRLAAAGLLAALLAGVSAGLLTAAYHALAGDTASHAYCATLRTGILAGSAVLLAWAGSHPKFAELSRLAYPAMLLGAWRLAADYLHQDRKTALFLSLLIYGVSLMALPRFQKQPLSWLGHPKGIRRP